jgi:hypothetical protein
VREPRYREYVVAQFLSGSYGWMWPFRRSIENWYDSVVTELQSKEEA